MPKPAEQAPETAAKKTRRLASYPVWMFVAAFLYFFSIGPIALMVKNGIIGFNSKRSIEIYCGPYTYLYENAFLRRPLGMYLHSWRPDVWDGKGEPMLTPATES